MLNDAVQMGCPQVEFKLLDQKVFTEFAGVLYFNPLIWLYLLKGCKFRGMKNQPRREQ